MDAAQERGTGQQRGLGATVPEEAFSPESLAAHIAAAAPGRSSPDPAAGTVPLLDRPGLAERLRLQGLSAPGPALARFTVDRVLGVGATGRVYSVLDRNLERAIAVKFLGDGERSPDAGEIGHFVDEAQITASLEHPNVLPVHELEVNDAGQVYFTMKKIDGRSLGALIEQSTPALRAAPLGEVNALVNLFVGVAQALAYAHDRGIVHQDVKPENIMVGDYGEVLLVDWGSAVRLQPDTRPRLYGTPLYMSPEQARREGVDRRSDLYCLGATLFHALVLRPPTWEDDAERFWSMKRAGIIVPPSAEERAAAPPRLLDIALKALAPDPAQRYQSATLMLDDLRNFQAGLAVSAHRDTWLEALGRWHRRHWRALWAGSAIAAVVVALGAALYGERLKEIATWGEPAAVETFADEAGDAWRGRWALVGGGFERRDGHLVSTGKAESTIVWPTKLWGSTAIEYEGEIRSGALPGDISLVWARDFDPAKRQLIDAYYVQVGAFDGAYCAIRSGDRMLAYGAFAPQVGRRYRIRVEIDDARLTLSIDGRRICEVVDNVRFDGGYFALDAYYPGKAFSDVRVYGRSVAQKVPVTAIGDTLLRLHRYDDAFEQYGRVVASYRSSALGLEAVYKQGLCRWEQHREDEALALWAPLAGTSYETLTRLYAIDRRFASADHAGALTDLEALYRAAEPAMRMRVAARWGFFVDQLRVAKDGAGVADCLASYERTFAGESVVEISAADAYGFVRRFDEVLRRFAGPSTRRQYAWALFQRGRAHEVVEGFADQRSAYLVACFATGEFARMEATDPDDLLMDEVRVKTGRAAEVVARPSRDALATIFACCALGRLDEMLARTERGELHGVALVFLGRAAEAAAGDDPHEREIGLLALGEGAAALDAARPPIDGRRARYLLGLQAWMRGDEAEGRRWFDGITPNPDGDFEEALVRDWIVPMLEHPGDASIGDRALSLHDRWRREQRTWYMAHYLHGDLDDAAFLAQPYRLQADARLLLLKGMRREREGRRAEALEAFRAYDALPLWRRELWSQPLIDPYVRWRIEQLSR